ncbi:MAG: zonular occludens toxin domain-containing protein [Lachnospiraceae bacterium]|nr:zonular occludens toxin domain-containing protein [Lachnospiraceae bacterium]
MIKLYTGTPGSGKSLHLADVLYWRIKNHKGLVICNFEMNLANIKARRLKSEFIFLDNDQLTPNRLEQMAYDYESKIGRRAKEGELLLVIDECQLMFNSRDWQRGDRGGWLKFFTQHRKFGYDIILVAQFDRMIDRQIRSLIEYEWVHRKVSNYGIAGKLIGLVFLGSLFVCIKVWYPMKEKVGSEFFVGKKRYFNMYDTRKMFDGDSRRDGGVRGPAGAAEVHTEAIFVPDTQAEAIASELMKFGEENNKSEDGGKREASYT